MSRGIRDLRDLICVSRLTIRDSDEEIPWSDEEGEEGVGGSPLDKASLSSGTDSRQSSAQSLKGRHSRDVRSPDSGISTNGRSVSPTNEPESPTVTIHKTCPKPPSEPVVGGMRRKKKRKIKILDTVPHRHDLPKAAPLPPLPGAVFGFDSRPSSSSSDGSNRLYPADRDTPLDLGDSPARRTGNFDDMLTFLDSTVISEWLTHSNGNVADMASWCHTDDNFVQFAHFWLTDFPDLQKQEILKMEYSIILDQLEFAFRAGRDTGRVCHKDILRFLDAVFREYPGRLFSSKRAHMFLDYLDILSSERRSRYKTLLSDVKVSTRIKHHAQSCLAVRSFALVSVWVSVVKFYRRLVPNGATKGSCVPVPVSQIAAKEPSVLRMQQAIRAGFVDVVNYIRCTGQVRANYKDNHQRSLVFSAVMHGQPKVLQYLLTQTEAVDDINHSGDTGNTPLHAAANSGDLACLNVLLLSPKIKIDVKNTQCENATALHLATLHGYTEVVKALIKAGADVNLSMGELAVRDIAQDFDHTDILQVLDKLVH